MLFYKLKENKKDGTTYGYHMKKTLISNWIVLFIFWAAAHGFAAEKLPVFVSIVPQKYFVQQIGKDLVDVQVMVQPGASPATYEPRPSQMAALSRTKLYFSIGVPFEQTWLTKIVAANPAMEVVPTDQGIDKISMAAFHDDEVNKHHEGQTKANDESDHRHTGLDPHIWLSPALVKIQSLTILMALKKADPENANIYEKNHQVFARKIETLDTTLHQMFDDNQTLQFMVFHPSWGYFARAYGLKQMPIEIQGKNPKPAQLKKLIQDARKNKINVIFVQPQFSTKSAALIAREIKGQILFADPLAADWMNNMQLMAKKFREALR